ncbi:IS5 family transposase [Streptomyces mirabilis]|uniref:IS5 family transposase n=1 Tax=Streptomyces mirabilis TaxID=68239 RepID=UPI0032452FCD
MVAGGISWRAMPADIPDGGRVYAFFRRWREHGLITEFHDRLRGKVRECESREAESTAGIIDAQSVRAAATVPAASRGYNGGKKVPGRKRHIVTDSLSQLLVVAVTAANIGDRDAAGRLLTRLRRNITLVWADGGYTGGLVDWCRDKLALTLEIVKRTDDTTGFVVLPRRWVAERTFAWLMNFRRLARDYETLPASSEEVIRWSMVTRMSRRRLARPRASGGTEHPPRLQELPGHIQVSRRCCRRPHRDRRPTSDRHHDPHTRPHAHETPALCNIPQPTERRLLRSGTTMLVRTDIVLPELARRSAHSSSARPGSSALRATGRPRPSRTRPLPTRSGVTPNVLQPRFFARHPRTAPSVRRQSQVNNRFKLPYVVCGTG